MLTRTPRKKLLQKQSEEQVLPCSISPAPKQRAMMALLPAPSMVATAERIENTGPTTETAATCAVSPRQPTKNISAMLYSTMTRIMIMEGTAMEMMDFQTEPVRKSASFFMVSSQKSTARRQNESPCQGSFPSCFGHRLSSAPSSAFSAVSGRPSIGPILPNVMP